MSNTQLTSASGYNPKNMIFNKSTNPKNNRIMIGTKNPDGTVGDLVIQSEKVFSFGVSHNRDPTTKAVVDGYNFPLCLWNKNGASTAEKAWSDKFDEIIEYTKNHLLTCKDDYGLYELDDAELKKFNPLYWRKEKGKVVPGTGPTLYAKLIYSKRDEERDREEKIKSSFYDDDTGDELDPYQLIGKFCYATAAIKIESIFLGNKPSLQVKLYEVNVSLLEKGMKRLLPSIPRKVQAVVEEEYDDEEDVEYAHEQDDDVGSLVDSEDDYMVDKQPSPVRKSAPKKRRSAAK